MKVWTCAVGGVLCWVAAAGAQTPEALLKNGDFSQGKLGWQGQGKAATLEAAEGGGAGNPCLAIDLDDKKERVVKQRIHVPRDVTGLKVQAKVCIRKQPKESYAAPGGITLWLVEEEKESSSKDKNKNKNKKKDSDKVVRTGKKGEYHLSLGDAWTPLCWEATGIEDPKKIQEFQIVLAPGKGIIHIDDLVIEPLAAKQAVAAP